MQGFDTGTQLISLQRRTAVSNIVKMQNDSRIPAIEKEMLEGSRPLMAYTNLLTFNSRAIVLYITALLNCPWVFMLFEIVVLTSLYIYMHHSHERLCKRLFEKMESN